MEIWTPSDPQCKPEERVYNPLFADQPFQIRPVTEEKVITVPIIGISDRIAAVYWFMTQGDALDQSRRPFSGSFGVRWDLLSIADPSSLFKLNQAQGQVLQPMGPVPINYRVITSEDGMTASLEIAKAPLKLDARWESSADLIPHLIFPNTNIDGIAEFTDNRRNDKSVDTRGWRKPKTLSKATVQLPNDPSVFSQMDISFSIRQSNASVRYKV